MVRELCLPERHLHAAQQVKAAVYCLFMSGHFFRISRHRCCSAISPSFLFLFCLPGSFLLPLNSPTSGSSGPLTPPPPHPSKRIGTKAINQWLNRYNRPQSYSCCTHYICLFWHFSGKQKHSRVYMLSSVGGQEGRRATSATTLSLRLV